MFSSTLRYRVVRGRLRAPVAAPLSILRHKPAPDSVLRSGQYCSITAKTFPSTDCGARAAPPERAPITTASWTAPSPSARASTVEGEPRRQAYRGQLRDAQAPVPARLVRHGYRPILARLSVAVVHFHDHT